MSGHSKWSKVKRIKEVNDPKKSALLTKASREIVNAVKIGQSGDPVFNPALKIAIANAKSVNMPSDRIDRAIKTGLGEKDSGAETVFKTYELLGENGENILVDVETDNANRSITDIRIVSFKFGYKILPENSIAWKFRPIGLIQIKKDIEKENKDDSIMLKLMDFNGILDLNSKDNIIEIKCEKGAFRSILVLLDDLNLEVILAKLIKECEEKISLEENQLEKLREFISLEEENSEISNIWTNVKL